MLVVRQLVGLRRWVCTSSTRRRGHELGPRGEVGGSGRASGSVPDQPDEYEAQERGIERLFIEIAANRVVPLLNESVADVARPEVVRAFMGPLEQHHQANQALLEAVG